jgi:DNA-directed RNA polymerase subunit N (RpoN/RPB10)
MARKNYKCFNCGKLFEKQYQMLLHYDFHKGETVVREAGCVCGAGYDVRCGKCLECGAVYSAGWVLA